MTLKNRTIQELAENFVNSILELDSDLGLTFERKKSNHTIVYGIGEKSIPDIDKATKIEITVEIL
jgi:hypothetical protein